MGWGDTHGGVTFHLKTTHAILIFHFIGVNTSFSPDFFHIILYLTHSSALVMEKKERMLKKMSQTLIKARSNKHVNVVWAFLFLFMLPSSPQRFAPALPRVYTSQRRRGFYIYKKNVDFALTMKLAYSVTGTGCGYFPYLSPSTFRRTAGACWHKQPLLTIHQTHNAHTPLHLTQKTHAGKCCRL